MPRNLHLVCGCLAVIALAAARAGELPQAKAAPEASSKQASVPAVPASNPTNPTQQAAPVIIVENIRYTQAQDIFAVAVASQYQQAMIAAEKPKTTPSAADTPAGTTAAQQSMLMNSLVQRLHVDGYQVNHEAFINGYLLEIGDAIVITDRINTLKIHLVAVGEDHIVFRDADGNQAMLNTPKFSTPNDPLDIPHINLVQPKPAKNITKKVKAK